MPNNEKTRKTHPKEKKWKTNHTLKIYCQFSKKTGEKKTPSHKKKKISTQKKTIVKKNVRTYLCEVYAITS